MKRVGYLIEEIASLDNLYLAYYKASVGKRHKKSVFEYSKNISYNIKQLRCQLETGEVNVGDYHYFTITDPKERKICAAAFSERVLHHALMNVCHKYFENTLIYDTYATRINKGVYAALSRGQQAMKENMWVAKLDYKKYFDSISHEVLKTKLRRLFKDVRLLNIFEKIIDSYNSGLDGRGVPIGNLTSQYFANHYLSNIDHYAKDVLNTNVYIRYMDDILMFDYSKELLKEKILSLNTMSNEMLLKLKPAVINKCEQGMPFLGYKIFPQKIILNNRSKRRFKYKISKYNYFLNSDLWSQNEYQSHITPLLAFTQHAYTKQMRMVVLRNVYCI